MHPASSAGQGGVQVFDIDLDAFSRASKTERLDVLDDAERQRAARMATPLLRQRYVAAHAAMRVILAEALDVEPGSLRFGAGALGKPVLVEPPDRGVHFNLSHCQGRALLAVADSELGIDIEAWIERDTTLLAAEVLAPGELERFQECPVEQQPQELARIWAAKEALFKACGLGLQIAPASMAVDLAGGWHTLPAPADTPAWWLQRIDVDGAFCACLATRHHAGIELIRYC